MSKKSEVPEGDFKIVDENLYDKIVPLYIKTNESKHRDEYMMAEQLFKRAKKLSLDMEDPGEFYFKLASLLVDEIDKRE